MIHDKKATGSTPFILSVILLLLTLSGCAGHRWSEPLAEEENTKVVEILTAMRETDKSCPSSFDADALIFWKNPLDDAGVSGYLQLLSPSFVKFIVSNPLGQPIYAFSSNGSTYQSLNSRKHQHIRGNISTLAIRQELPQVLAQGDWFAYISGRLPSGSFNVVKVNRDISDATVWLLLAPSDSRKTPGATWLHLNPETRTLLGYLFLDREGKTLAEIFYDNQEKKTDYCIPNEKMTVSELPWGTEIKIVLKEIRTDTEYIETDFSLPVPKGYFKQLQP